MTRLRSAELFAAPSPRTDAGVDTDLRRDTTRGVAWTLVANLGSRVLSTAVMILLARILRPSEFGLVALATVAIMVLTVIVDGGFAAALVQVRTMTKDHYDTAFWTSAGTGVLATAIAVGLAGPLASFFHEPDLAPTLRWLSLVLLISGFSSTPQAVLQRRFEFRALAGRLLFANLVGGAVGVVVALRGGGAWALVAQTVVKQLVQAIVVWWACPVLPGTSMTAATFRSMFRFGLSVTGLQALNTVNKRSDDLLVGRYLGKVALGYYNVAYSLLLLLNQLLMQTIGQVAFPLFARLQHDTDRMRTAMFEVVRLTALVTFPVYILVVVVAPDLVPALFGPNWGPAIPVMQVLATVGVPQTLWVFLGAMLVGAGKASWNFRLNVVFTAMLVVGFAISVQWGILAVATSFTISTFAFAPVQMRLVQRIFPYRIPTYLAQFVSPGVAVAVMAGVVFAVRLALLDAVGVWPRLLICVSIAPVVYVGTLLVVGRPLLQEAAALAGHLLPPRAASRLRRLVGSGTPEEPAPT